MSTPRPDPHNLLAENLIGTWSLLSREDFTAAGERRIESTLGSDPIALLFFDRTGHFAAQFMKRDRAAATISAPAPLAGANNSRAQGGYDAYFGTYEIDEPSGNVATRLIGSLSPENVGQVFTRNMRVTGDELTIRLETTTSTSEPVTRTLRWKRVG